jgi:hypothetical protein
MPRELSSQILGPVLAGAAHTQQAVEIIVPGPRAVDPGNIGQLRSWYRADDLTLNDGETVALWPDRSPSEIDAGQGVVARRPRLRLGVLNGRPAVEFDGTDDALIGPPGPGSQMTVFLVARGSPRSLLRFQENETDYVVVGDANGQFAVSNQGALPLGLTDNRWHIITARLAVGQSGGLHTWLDGVTQGVTDASSNGLGQTTLYLGAKYDGTEAFQGALAEVISYSRALSLLERQRVEQYLASRYNLPLYYETTDQFTLRAATIPLQWNDWNWEGDLRGAPEIRFSEGRAPDNAELTLTNLSLRYGAAMIDPARQLDGARVRIYWLFERPDGTWDGDEVFNGLVVAPELVDTGPDELLKLEIASDINPPGVRLGARPRSFHCVLQFKGPKCGAVTAAVHCSRLFDDAVEGCKAYGRQHRFQGLPTMGALATQAVTGGVDPTLDPQTGWPRHPIRWKDAWELL